MSAWVEHLPFAMWLTSVLRPSLLVELGAFRGVSYCGFCQAITALCLPCRAFAVDTWEGDRHAGAYGPDVLAELKEHHDHRYGRFSTLLQMTFDGAVSRFADGEIDLLHIDGYHAYEAVRHDFETWLPKLSRSGVILFHDVSERTDDFGVWKLWDELQARYPSFSFEHEHGLGVLAVGPDRPAELQWLLGLRGGEIDWVRALFESLGQRIRLRMEVDSLLHQRDEALQNFAREQGIRAQLQADLDSRFPALELEVQRLIEELRHIHSSLSWCLTHRVGQVLALLAPPGSIRRRLVAAAASLGRSPHMQK